ncbi:hypothetical protein BU16DRAFT_212205 [Lophium mytilinum]|uniref:Zn(2)-C6 fungal-type domain-containing protein n=1 Tax=Lophium mytilinum TaxID=390894 RepID=A0A6A6RBT0_9PEZI|nr:hypothetical protein BU16DRAFT_212205 [Lophium mytilinum]
MRPRLACDRCHTHKLRCTKPEGSQYCNRCLSASTPCHFSVSLRGFRPNGSKGRRQHPSHQPSCRDNGQEMLAVTPEDGLFDPNLISWEEDVPAGLLPEDPFDRAMEALHFPAPMSSSTTSSGTLSGLSARDRTSTNGTEINIPDVEIVLTRLLQNISEHILTIPPLSMWPSASSSSSSTYNFQSAPEIYTHPDGSRGDTGFAIEETFSLTQTMVDAYKSFVSPLRNQTHQANLSCSTVHLLISCHLRLLEMWDVVFRHMGHCVALATMAAASGRTQVSVPAIKMGEFAPSSSIATHLHLMLISTLAGQLQKGIREVLGELSARPTEVSCIPSFGAPSEQYDSHESSEGTSLNEATRLSCEALANRAAVMVRRVDEIQLQIRDVNL